MVSLFTLLGGALLAVTVMQNGDLAAFMGNYRATVAVHGVGLITLLAWMLLRREKFHLDRRMPWLYYMGGVLGVLTVVCLNLTYAELGVSVSLALGLLGQSLMGGIIDQFGLFHSVKRPFCRQHILSFALIIGGIVVMLVM
ncbi:MAG: DMT family transporter [Eubacteriales bacterium]|nr:DMT family transporter [Eubacteriales bacterium]